MLTLNQIKSRLVTFFDNHAQVTTVKYEKNFAFNAERSLEYPVVNIEYLSSNINENITNHRYKIVIGDRFDGNVEGLEDEIYSDSMLIAEDFFSWLQVQEGFNFRKSSNIQPYSDDTGDRVSGLVFQVELSVVRSQNECSIPTK